MMDGKCKCCTSFHVVGLENFLEALGESEKYILETRSHRLNLLYSSNTVTVP